MSSGAPERVPELQELAELRHELQARVRELSFLQRLADLVDGASTVEEVLQSTVELIPHAWEYPEFACARIRYREQEFKTANFGPNPSLQACDLRVFQQVEGCIEVGYVSELAPGLPGPFSGEAVILNTVAKRVGRSIERFRTMQALHASENKFRSVVEQSHDGIVLTDDSGKVIEWNKGMERITGYASERIMGRPIWEVQADLTPREHKAQEMQERMQARLRAFYRSLPQPWRGLIQDMEIQRPDGTRAIIHASLFVIEAGEAILACAVFRDITEAKADEESLRKLSSAVEQSPTMVTIADTDMVVEYVNPRFTEVTGYTPDEVVGQKLYQKRSTLDPEIFLESIRQSVSEGEDWRGELLSRKKSGEPYWERVSVTAVRDRLGRITHYLQTCQDITVSKRIEHARDESETKLRAIFESSRDAIGVSQAGIHVIVNPAYVTMFGYTSRDELMGVPIIDLIAPSERPRIIDYVRRRAAGENVPFAYETRGLRRDGAEFDMGVRASNYELGGASYTLVILRDITERKRAEEALRASREQYRALVDDMPAVVCRFEPNGVLTFVNNSITEYLGKPPEELVGTSVLGFMRPEDQPQVQKQLAALTAENSITTFANPLPGADQETHWLRWTIRALCDKEGAVTEFQALGEDITRDVEAQQALQRAKEEAEAAREREELRYQEAERRREIAEGLGDVVAALNSDRPLCEVLDYILHQAGKLLGNEASAIFRLAADGEYILDASRDLAITGITERDLAGSQEALRQAIENRQVVMVQDILTFDQGQTDKSEDDNPYAFRSILAVPVVVQDKTYGSLVLFYSGPRNFRADEVELGLILTHQVALAVENARLHEEAERVAVTAERTRLARDLHDAVTQTLFSASIMAEALPRVWQQDPVEGQRGLEELQQLTRGALAEMRTLLLELRPTGIAEKPLGVILQQLVDAVSSRTRLPISLTVEGETCLSPEAQTAFYRIAQEALNNVAKHAHATHVSVCFKCERGEAHLEIQDNGQGFDTNKQRPGKHGMGTMYERAASIHAALEIASTPGRGTRVSIYRQMPEGEQG